MSLKGSERTEFPLHYISILICNDALWEHYTKLVFRPPAASLTTNVID